MVNCSDCEHFKSASREHKEDYCDFGHYVTDPNNPLCKGKRFEKSQKKSFDDILLE